MTDIAPDGVPDPTPRPRSLTWRILPWVVPLGLILVGLIVVGISLSGNDRPDTPAAPPNVRDITIFNAPGWATRQVDAATPTEVLGVTMVESAATGPTTYSIRAVITRVDGVDDLAHTVVTCVRWDLDVSTGMITELGATPLGDEPGRNEADSSKATRERCHRADLPA